MHAMSEPQVAPAWQALTSLVMSVAVQPGGLVRARQLQKTCAPAVHVWLGWEGPAGQEVAAAASGATPSLHE
jgi:hypothetical protein